MEPAESFCESSFILDVIHEDMYLITMCNAVLLFARGIQGDNVYAWKQNARIDRDHSILSVINANE